MPAPAQPSAAAGTVGRAKALLGHHRRGAEDHHQSDEDQQQRDREQPFVDADALGHLFTASRSAAAHLFALLLPRRQVPDQIFEDPSAMFVIVELIEAGAGRSQQHHVAAVAASLARFTAASSVPALTISVPLACDSIFAAAAPMVYTRFTRSFSKR